LVVWRYWLYCYWKWCVCEKIIAYCRSANHPLNSLIGFLNDLWKYNVSENKWYWISGSSKAGQQGKYGEKGKSSSNNVPGGRRGAVGWFDSSRQEFWLFGGIGYIATGSGAFVRR